MVLRLAGVFGFLQMTLLLKKFAHPWLTLCVKKHKRKSGIAVNKTQILQPMFPLKLHKCAEAYYQTICAAKYHLAHLQHSKSLEKHENTKLFELNVLFVRIFIRFYTYFKNALSL